MFSCCKAGNVEVIEPSKVQVEAANTAATTPKSSSSTPHVVLAGPPGAGKGAVSEKLVADFNIVHTSTGQILRDEIASNSEIGLKAKQLVESGALVPEGE